MAYLCVVEIEVHFPEVGSLKGKRSELSSLKANLQRRFGAAVAETGHHELWQRAALTAALVGGEFAPLRDRVAGLERYVRATTEDAARVETRLLSTEDLT